jgi:hypothetical protein
MPIGSGKLHAHIAPYPLIASCYSALWCAANAMHSACLCGATALCIWLAESGLVTVQLHVCLQAWADWSCGRQRKAQKRMRAVGQYMSGLQGRTFAMWRRATEVAQQAQQGKLAAAQDTLVTSNLRRCLKRWHVSGQTN